MSTNPGRAEFTVANGPELILDRSGMWGNERVGAASLYPYASMCLFACLRVHVSERARACHLDSHQLGARLLSRRCTVMSGAVTAGDAALQLITEKDG